MLLSAAATTAAPFWPRIGPSNPGHQGEDCTAPTLPPPGISDQGQVTDGAWGQLKLSRQHLNFFLIKHPK